MREEVQAGRRQAAGVPVLRSHLRRMPVIGSRCTRISITTRMQLRRFRALPGFILDSATQRHR